MSGISSNLTVAGNVSSSFSRCASELMNIQSATVFADRTNITGNSAAKKSSPDLIAQLHAVSDSIARDGNNIHSVAKEFSAIDQHIQTKIGDFLFTIGPGTFR